MFSQDQPPRGCNRDPEVRGGPSEPEVLKPPTLTKLPSVLTKPRYFKDHKNSVKARVYEFFSSHFKTVRLVSLAPGLVHVGAWATCLPGRLIQECETPQGIIPLQQQVLLEKRFFKISCLINEIHRGWETDTFLRRQKIQRKWIFRGTHSRTHITRDSPSWAREGEGGGRVCVGGTGMRWGGSGEGWAGRRGAGEGWAGRRGALWVLLRSLNFCFLSAVGAIQGPAFVQMSIQESAIPAPDFPFLCVSYLFWEFSASGLP